MRKMKVWSKVLSLALAIIMLLGMIPVLPTAVAAEEEKEPIVLDFLQFAKDVSKVNLWRSLRTATGRGIKALGLVYGTQPTAKYTQALKDLETWFAENSNWSIPNLYEGDLGHYNHPYGARRIYIDSYSGNYGIRLYSDYPGNGSAECQFLLNFEVPAGKAGVYKLLVETFDEAMESIIQPCDKTDLGGATATFYLNDEPVGGQNTYAAEEDSVVEHNLLRVDLKEGTNTLRIVIDGDRFGNAAAGRAALNLRKISFVDPGEACAHPETSAEYTPNMNRTHRTMIKCLTCGETLERSDNPCEDGDDEDLLCDLCGYNLKARPADDRVFAENSVVINFQQFAYEAMQQDWFYRLRASEEVDGARMIGTFYGEEPTEESYEAAVEMQAWMDENCNWALEELIDGSPRLTHQYGARRVIIDSINDWFGIRFYSDLVNNTGSNVSQLRLLVDVPVTGSYDINIETFDEAYHSVVPIYDRYDNGGGTYDIYVNDVLIVENHTFCTWEDEDIINTITLEKVFLEEGINSIVFFNKGTRDGANGYAGRSALNLRYIEMVPAGPCEHLNTTSVLVKNEREHTHSEKIICMCREVLSDKIEPCMDANGDKLCDKCEQILVFRTGVNKTFPEDSIVLDFQKFAYDVVHSEQWYDLRQSTLYPGGKSICGGAGDQIPAAQKQATMEIDQWMKENLNWWVPDMSDYTTSDGYRHLYFDGLTDRYGLRFYSHKTGTAGTGDEDTLHLAFTVPEGKGGMYAMDLYDLLECMQSKIERHDGWDSGGGTTTIYLNGEVILKDYVFIKSLSDADSDVLDHLMNIGPVELKDGINTLDFDVNSDVWQLQQAGRAGFNLNYIEFKPLKDIKTAEYQTAYRDLNLYYMPYGQSAAGFTAKVEDPWIASAAVDSLGNLSVTGLKTGTTNIQIMNGSKVHWVIPVTVGDFTGSLDELMGTPVKMDFVTTVDRAKEQSWWTGTAAVSVEGDFNTYLKDNAKWHLASGTGVTANGDDNTYGLKVKGSNTFNVELPASGLYNVTVEYLRGGGKMDISVNGKTLYAGLDTAGTAATVKASLGVLELPAGKNTLTFSTDSDVYLRSVTITPMGVQQTEVGVSRYMDLNETYLPFDAKVENPTAVSDSDAVEVSFNANGILILAGKKVGTATVTVSAGGETVATIPVKVVAAGKLLSATYTLDGFTATTMKPGYTAIGDLSSLTTKLTTISEAYLRDAGSVYFKSSDPSIAKVDQATGDVTTIAEGTAVISAYALFDGNSVNTSATVTVTDDTDLEIVNVEAPVDYVGIGNVLKMAVSGKKASGVAADMGLYPVSWSVDNEEIAIIDPATGRLTGLKEGTVTVTATAGVQRVAITGSKVIKVVPTDQLAGGNLFFDFVLNHYHDIQNFTLDTHDVAINRELSSGGGYSVKVNSRGIKMDVEKGEQLALDFRVSKSGWYEVELRGSNEANALYANGFVDDTFIGDIEFAMGLTNEARGGYNTLWLDAGIHTLRLYATEAGQIPFNGMRFFATSDPNEVEISLNAEKLDLIPGEKVDVSMLADPANDNTFSLLLQSSKPNFTNYYILSSSDPNVLSVSGTTVTAKAAGTADVVLTGEVDGKEVTKTLTVKVSNGVIASAKVDAENTTVKPTAESFPLIVTAYGLDGNAIELPAGTTVSYESSDETIVTVDADGNAKAQGKEGSALITATIDENGHILTTTVWITATEGKQKPTLYTYEERAIAQENVLKYDWAWQQKEAAVVYADLYVEALDIFYKEILHPQTWPGNNYPAFHNSATADANICPMCETNLVIYDAFYPWKFDPINKPWKITCPHCNADFPSNDFRSYYFSGLGEDGKFDPELADPQYLVNELYPEKGEGWCVDDGWGWYTGKKGSNGRDWTYTFISHFIRKTGYPLTGGVHDFLNVLDCLGKAYMYTGDEKYGNAGAILVDRLADIYPTWDISDFPIEDYHDCDGNGGGGYMFGETWDGHAAGVYAKAADIFWPCMDNPEVIDYIAEHAAWKGLTAEDITPEYIRSNVDENLLLHIWEGLQTADVTGNFGLPQLAAACTAVALDRLPETQDILDWLFQDRVIGGSWLEETSYATGGGLLTTYVGEVKRDGLGNEGSLSYNSLWESYNVETFNALNGYERVPSADMWKNSKVITMFHAAARLMTSQSLGVNLHETSGWYQMPGMMPNLSRMVTAFVNTGDHTLARAIYAFNNNSTNGIHGDIFTKNPESGIRGQIEQIVRQDGKWEMGKSDMMPGYGMSFLREGPSDHILFNNTDEYHHYVMYYGDTKTDHHKEHVMNIDLAAFGLVLSGDLGYPIRVDSNPERLEWVANTVSGNTVVVNDHGQMKVTGNGFPYHFADDGKVKVMDADAPHVYTETDIYRRTMVTVDNGDGVPYAVDFFRVLGGDEHVYSFHAASKTDPVVTGIDLIEQPMGTYAGPDVAFGADPAFNAATGSGTGSGYSWLYNVARDNDPDTVFSLDWPIMDHWNQYPELTGVHLKLTMLSEEPVTEVATAHGKHPQDGRNPEHLEYLLVRQSGADGMDTLFTTVFEPYQYNNYIAKSELVDVELIDGTEGVTDRAAAVKVTLTSGRVDYIVYATDTECTYRIDDLFDFKGFTGVVSYEDGAVIYAWGDEATIVTDLITDAQPRITGEVLSFTEGLAESYEMTVTMDQPVDEDQLIGKWLYIKNDGTENAAYRIDGIDITGNTAKIDLSFQCLIRNYVDKMDLSKGFVYNIAVGDTYELPLSTEFDVTTLFSYTADKVVKAGNKLTLTTGVAGSGVTYEAEGLPTGAKFTASNGTITWTVSRTQTGRYPITVKAIDENGDVLGEMSFVIYVVAYTGSTYDASICTHTKAVTYTTETSIEVVCPACGTISKTAVEPEQPEEPDVPVEPDEPIEKFNIVGSNMTLGNELKLNIMANTTDLEEGYYAKITHNGETVEADFARYNSTYSFVSVTMAAAQMADEITVEVYDEDGNAVSNVYTTSIRNYAMGQLNKSSTNAKTKTLLVDMLNYGAAAQENFGYNTEDLANSLLTDEQKALATAPVETADHRVKGENYYGSNLSLENKILLNFFFKGVEEGMYAEVSFGTTTVTMAFEEFEKYNGNIYKIPVDDIALAESFELVTVTVYNADGTVHGTATDSVESYIARSAASDLNEAIMKFAASAKVYFS